VSALSSVGQPFVAWIGNDPEQFIDTMASDQADDPSRRFS
jgi:hypothetical protein